MEREDALFREKPNFYGEMLWVDGWLQGSGALAGSSRRGRETAAGWKKTDMCGWAGMEEEAVRRDQEAGKNRTEWQMGNN